MNNDTTSSIIRSAKRFISGTILSRVTGMLRDVSMAYVFGAEPAIGAFMVSFRLAHLLRRLFGEGALQSAFVPTFEKLRHEDEAKGYQFFSSLFVALSLMLVLLILIMGGGCLFFLRWGSPNAQISEILWLMVLMLPSLLFICLYGLNASLLQCEKSYFTSGVAPVAFNLAWIGVVFCLRGVPPVQAMPYLAGGIILACFCQWGITVPQTVRLLRTKSKLSIDFACLKPLLGPLALAILGVAATQVNSAIDSLFAFYAEPGGPAFLWYASRLNQMPMALFGVALSGALLPPLSRALKAGDRPTYTKFLIDGLEKAFAFCCPLTFAFFAVGFPLVNLIFGHGDFSLDSVRETTYCLWAYTIGLIPAVFILLLAPAYYAQHDYKRPTIASFVNMGVNLVLNSLFIFVFGWGAVSVAIATSISSWLNVILLGQPFFTMQGQYINRSLKILLCALAAYIGTSYLSLLFFEVIDATHQVLVLQIVSFFAQGGIFVMLYSIFYCLTFVSLFDRILAYIRD